MTPTRKPIIEETMAARKLEHLTRLLLEVLGSEDGRGDVVIGCWNGEVQTFEVRRKEDAGDDQD